MDCHHLNGYSLDNRSANLVNINPKIHAHIHKLLGRLRKNPGGSPEKNQDGRQGVPGKCLPVANFSNNIDFHCNNKHPQTQHEILISKVKIAYQKFLKAHPPAQSLQTTAIMFSTKQTHT